MLLILLGAMAVAGLVLTFFAGSSTNELSGDPNNPGAAGAESMIRAGRSASEVVLGLGGFASILAGFATLRRGRRHLVDLAQ